MSRAACGPGGMRLERAWWTRWGAWRVLWRSSKIARASLLATRCRLHLARESSQSSHVQALMPASAACLLRPSAAPESVLVGYQRIPACVRHGLGGQQRHCSREE